MKRSRFLRRRTWLRRRKPMTQVSDKRRLENEEYLRVRIGVLERDGYACRAPLMAFTVGGVLIYHKHPHRSHRGPVEVHHVIKRSAAPHLRCDPDNLISLCRAAHAWTDAPYQHGRLVIESRGRGDFTLMVVRAPSKYARPDLWEVFP